MTPLECQQTVASVIGRYRGPLVFHTADCAAAVVQAYHALGLAHLGPEAWTKKEAATLLRVHDGGIAPAVTALLAPFGWTELPPVAPALLDLGLCRLGTAESLAIWHGQHWMARGPRGPLLLATAETSWRPPAEAIGAIIGT